MTFLKTRRVIPWLMMLCLIGAQATWLAVTVSAQQKTLMEGAKIVQLTSAESDNGGGQLVRVRVTLDPHASLRPHRHPGAAIVSVETGEFWTELLDGSATITRSTESGYFSYPESAQLGLAVSLDEGDSISYADGAIKTVVNTSDEKVVLTIVLMTESGSEYFEFEHMEAMVVPRPLPIV